MQPDRASSAAYTVRLWALRRLLGLAMVVDGMTTFFTGWKCGLALDAAKRMAKLRHEKMMRERTVL